ncbi:EAL domain-containing protein [Aliivibrio fischeri]|uniref:EAL domain-containing protein n=1 Tax=Aliivibrio fischeri TaxID=668 RepID=UPI0012DA8F8D|nr:EAL domain-containing protein [Aliivibrio fischeri]MUK66852.1 EAL domain-containing protein [Aliivibrio fischeri]
MKQYHSTFKIYIQGIHSRTDIKRNLNTVYNSEGIEIFLENEKKTINNSDLSNLKINSYLLSWIEDNLLLLKINYKNAKFITINIDITSMKKLKNRLKILNKKLHSSSIFLLIKITKREHILTKDIVQSIYELNDFGIKFSVDDITIRDLQMKLIKLNIFEIIKIKLSDLYKIPNKEEFIKNMNGRKKKIVVDNIENIKDANNLLCEPINYLQGNLFYNPQVISKKEINI